MQITLLGKEEIKEGTVYLSFYSQYFDSLSHKQESGGTLKLFVTLKTLLCSLDLKIPQNVPPPLRVMLYHLEPEHKGQRVSNMCVHRHKPLCGRAVLGADNYSK